MASLNARNSWRPKIKGKYIAYIRSSDRPYSRLNDKAQRDAISEMISNCPARLIGEFVESEPLVAGERPALLKAIAECKAQNAKPMFGKLDRMRGIVQWLERIHGEGVGVAAVDLPHLSRDYFWRLYNERQSWRLTMSEKVGGALTEAKLQGAILGGKRQNAKDLKSGPAASVAARQRKAASRDWFIWQEIQLLNRRGVSSLTAIARRLNQMGRCAPRGGEWSPAQVRSVIKKIEGHIRHP